MLNNIRYEKSLWDKGIRYIAGVDEVGRGPLAGPLVVCAVILDLNKIRVANYAEPSMINDVYSQIKDSKKITDRNRRKIEQKLKNEVITYSIVKISNKEIDKIGIAKATQKAFYNAITKLKIPAEHILTDMFAIKNLSSEKQTNIPKGDSLSITIGAASIIAKVYRDNLMIKFHTKYPKYGFDRHKGYGTAKHMQAIKKMGICPIHRKSFEPIKSM